MTAQDEERARMRFALQWILRIIDPRRRRPLDGLQRRHIADLCQQALGPLTPRVSEADAHRTAFESEMREWLPVTAPAAGQEQNNG